MTSMGEFSCDICYFSCLNSMYTYFHKKARCSQYNYCIYTAPGAFQHTVNVGFDLRKLGFAPEFGLQILNEVSEKKLPQYTLDLHVNKEDKKYYLHIYSQPEQGSKCL